MITFGCNESSILDKDGYRYGIEVYERESVEDFASEHRYRQVGPYQALLKDAVKIYTRTMFHKLQDQFDQVVRFVAIERHVEGNVQQLTVKSHSGCTESFELEIELEKLTDSLVSRTMILNPLVVQTKGRAKTDYKKGETIMGNLFSRCNRILTTTTSRKIGVHMH
ncbi:hypothetical protein GIB67_018271 [Kingdonia uniflora]|uniref:Uncharacterized protein n=1 Tax=Kingdonia uniflora TaxID=39325 RepID=A0A7J7LES9_9MAGN|nr:hypothetical protein GIB67_018271 [Kingdonia uniflora]